MWGRNSTSGKVNIRQSLPGSVVSFQPIILKFFFPLLQENDLELLRVLGFADSVFPVRVYASNLIFALPLVELQFFNSNIVPQPITWLHNCITTFTIIAVMSSCRNFTCKSIPGSPLLFLFWYSPSSPCWNDPSYVTISTTKMLNHPGASLNK